MKQQEGKKEELKGYNKSVLDQSSSRVEKSQDKDKLKPSVLPFKGEASEEALKALKKKWYWNKVKIDSLWTFLVIFGFKLWINKMAELGHQD